MTKELHRQDPYRAKFESLVTVVGPNYVELDSTCFYARSGGQTGDTGILGGEAVVDTIYGPDGQVRHIFGPEADMQRFAEGISVEGEIDWVRRYKIMRLHTAQHLLYLAFRATHWEAPESGGDIGPEKCRVDMAHATDTNGPIDEAAIREWFTDMVNRDLVIKRLADPADDSRWYWEIEGLGSIPCGGTHVRTTMEVGDIDVVAKRKGSKNVRLTASIKL